MMKRPFLWFIALILLVTCFWWLRFLLTPLITDPAGFRYVLQPSASMQIFVSDLTQKNILHNPILFKILLRLESNVHEFKAGEYQFPKGTRPLQMIEQIAQGKGMIYHSITFIPGWTFEQIDKAISENLYLVHSHLKENELMARLGVPNVKAEGEFFPDTYYFIEGSSDIAVLKRAYNEMQKKLLLSWEARDQRIPLKNAYEALIAASLVEKEAYLSVERPIIAGVLMNRLNKNMILQFDPTVIYGMGSAYKGSIKKSDLRRDTPYNTYIHKGLPPTPIAIPSLDSIMAVLHPTQHNYLYFVAKGDGSHQFSVNLIAHNKAIIAAKKIKVWVNDSLIRAYLIKFFVTSP